MCEYIIRDFKLEISPKRLVEIKKSEITKEEIKKLEIKKKEEEENKLITILVIGSDNEMFFQNKLINLGLKLFFYTPKMLKLNNMQKKNIIEYPVNQLIKDLGTLIPDLIIIENISIHFTNQQAIPVIYYHNNIKQYPIINYPNAILYGNKEIQIYFEKEFAPYWCNQIQYKQVFKEKDYMKQLVSLYNKIINKELK